MLKEIWHAILDFILYLLGDDPDKTKITPNDVEIKECKKHNFYKRKSILSKAELSFYLTLKAIMPEQFQIWPKIGCIDVVGSKTGWRSIIQKHLDFTITRDFEPILAIELDDKSHDYRTEKDAEKNTILESAGLPLIRIKCQRVYDTKILEKTIFEKLKDYPPEVLRRPRTG